MTMNRERTSSLLAGLTAGLFLLTAILHHTGFRYVRDLALRTEGDLRTLVPPLWLFFSVNLVILGLAGANAARRPNLGHRPLFLCLALVPTSAAVLQLWFIGFIAPTALLLVDAALALATVFTLPPAPDVARSRPSDRGSGEPEARPPRR